MKGANMKKIKKPLKKSKTSLTIGFGVIPG